MWWPAGWGEANLYPFTLKYTPASGKASTLKRNLGLRTVELVQEPLQNPAGLTYYFRVNGIPIFARGMTPTIGSCTPGVMIPCYSKKGNM